jgi:hypothetical protein
MTVPKRENVKRIKTTIREVFVKHKHSSAYVLIKELNPILRGWGN